MITIIMLGFEVIYFFSQDDCGIFVPNNPVQGKIQYYV